MYKSVSLLLLLCLCLSGALSLYYYYTRADCEYYYCGKSSSSFPAVLVSEVCTCREAMSGTQEELAAGLKRQASVVLQCGVGCRCNRVKGCVGMQRNRATKHHYDGTVCMKLHHRYRAVLVASQHHILEAHKVCSYTLTPSCIKDKMSAQV